MGPLAKIFSGELAEYSSSLKLWVWHVNSSRDLPEPAQAFIETFEAGNVASILNSLNDGVILTDRAGKLKVFNRAAIKMLGIGAHEADSPGWMEKIVLYSADKKERLEHENFPSQRALRGEDGQVMEVFFIPPGSPEGVYLEITASPIKDDEGKTQGAISLIKDVTRRRHESEQMQQNKVRFETLAHLVNDVVWEWYAQRDVTMRHGVRKAFGYPEELVYNGQRWWSEKIHPEDLTRVMELFYSVMEGGHTTWSVEYRFRKSDGTYAYVIDHGKVVSQDAHGRAEHILGAVIDITQRRIEEEKLSLLATLVDSTDDAVFSVDFRGKVLSWNRGAEKMYGYSAHEMLGRGCDILLPAGSDKSQCSAFAAIERGESLKQKETWIVRKNGESIFTSATISPIRNAAGDFVGTCIAARDITESRKAADQIQTLAANLAKSNDELKQFAYLASHDLREPLRTISSFLSLVEKNKSIQLDLKTREYINFAVDGVNRMKVLVDTLLEYSTAEHSELQLKSVDCNRILNQVRDSLQLVIAETGAEIQWAHLPTLRGDEVQLGQLFQNLLSNALKYRSDKNPVISIQSFENDAGWIFSMRDNGIGIDTKFKDQVFNIFKRLHGRSEYPGSGLGLAICKKIVERHGGQIWFESSPATGTTFYFSVPN